MQLPGFQCLLAELQRMILEMFLQASLNCQNVMVCDRKLREALVIGDVARIFGLGDNFG